MKNGFLNTCWYCQVFLNKLHQLFMKMSYWKFTHGIHSELNCYNIYISIALISLFSTQFLCDQNLQHDCSIRFILNVFFSGVRMTERLPRRTYVSGMSTDHFLRCQRSISALFTILFYFQFAPPKLHESERNCKNGLVIWQEITIDTNKQ